MKITQFVSRIQKRLRQQYLLLHLTTIIWRVLVWLIFGITLLMALTPGTAQAKEFQAHAGAAQMASSKGVASKNANAGQVNLVSSACHPQDGLETCVKNIFPPNTYNGQYPSPLAGLGSGASTLGIEPMLLFYYTPLDITVENGTVQTFWKIVLGIVDAFIAFVLVLSGLRIMIAGTVLRHANVIEELPGALLALVAAHLSLTLVMIILGLNNALSVGIFDWIQGPNGIDNAKTLALNIQIVPTNLNLPNLGDVISVLFGNLPSLMIKVLGLMLLAQVIIRMFFINLYIILAPLGIACWALPGKAGQPLTRLWFSGFISTVMVQFLQVVAALIAELMLSAIYNALSSQVGNLDQGSLQNILAIAVLWFILRIPSLLGTASMRTLGEAGQAMGQAAGASLAVGASQLQGIAQIAGSAGPLVGLLAA